MMASTMNSFKEPPAKHAPDHNPGTNSRPCRVIQSLLKHHAASVAILTLALISSATTVADDTAAIADDGDNDTELDVIEVRERALQANAQQVYALDGDVIAQRQAQHPQQLLAPLPGVWISRGSGQEHLTAIRSPVFTGAGACGAFLEHNVPIRPAGFCNVNQLFEINLNNAGSVRVLPGPGDAQHGANALFGVIDVQAEPVALRPQYALRLDGGDNDFVRVDAQARLEQSSIAINHSDSNSFRADEGYQHFFGELADQRVLGTASVNTFINAAYLDQQTAGFILGEDAFRDPVLRKSNPNPEAFRQASAVRLVQQWRWQPEPTQSFNLTGFARRSRMEFLQHFLPGQPLENNGQESLGVQSDWQRRWRDSSLQIGLDAEWSSGFLREFQAEAISEGSAFLRETRPAGLHYDYDVNAISLSQWLRYQYQFSNGWQLDAGLRSQYLRYNYDNNMLSGNSRDDGTSCGFGGCLFTRPDDRRDDYFNLAPSLTLNIPLGQQTSWQWRIARGFRPPQATELYRLQNGQTVADLNSETLLSISSGIGGQLAGLRYQLNAFYQRSHDQIFRNADGFNVTDGAIRSAGIEWQTELSLGAHLQASYSGSFADHEYASDSFAGSGEDFVRGNQVDTAPKWQNFFRLQWQPGADLQFSGEVEHLGAYFLNAANSARYQGHTLVHLAAAWQPARQWLLRLRVENLFNQRYAERADFAFGNFRYFPGQGTTLRLSLGWQTD